MLYFSPFSITDSRHLKTTFPDSLAARVLDGMRFCHCETLVGAFLVAQTVKDLPAMLETRV